MKSVSISGSLRKNVGKKDAKMHRKEGRVPCVLYGGKEQVHFAAPELEFKKIIFTPSVYIVELNIDGKKYRSVLQDVQYHPVTDKILHMDFLEIFEDKLVNIAVPVHFTGTPTGVLGGGRLMKKFRKLRIKGLPKNLPDEIVVDISKLNIGQSIKVNELKEENIEFLDIPTAMVVSVKTARGTTAEDEETKEEESAEDAEDAKSSKE